MDRLCQFIRFYQREQGIEPGAEAHFEDKRPDGYKPRFNEYMPGFLYRPVNGMVSDIHFGDGNAVGTVFGYNDCSFQV
jgi:uncharacterized protein YukJ